MVALQNRHVMHLETGLCHHVIIKCQTQDSAISSFGDKTAVSSLCDNKLYSTLHINNLNENEVTHHSYVQDENINNNHAIITVHNILT